MELYQLESFVAIASTSSFTRAAEILHLSQPAITRQIAALEAELHTRLFDRMGRTVRLTAVGETLREYAGDMLRLAREAKQAVADVEEGTAGRLAVGASSTLATYVLPSILRRFRDAHPRVEISVQTGISADVIEMVAAGEIDLGLVTAVPDNAALVATILADYETRLVLPAGHPLAAQQALTPAALANIPLVLMESGTNLRAYTDRLLSAAGVEEQIALELDNVEATKRMVEAGLGISLLPEVAVRAEVEAGRLAALPLHGVPHSNRQITFVQRAGKYIGASMRAFTALVTESLAPRNEE